MTNKLTVPALAAAVALGVFFLQAEADDHGHGEHGDDDHHAHEDHGHHADHGHEHHATPAPLPANAALNNTFAGKIAVVYVQNALPEDGIMIRDAKLEQVGGRWFLTGETPDIGDPEDWMADTPVAVDWQRVESYNLLTTEEQFEERVVEPGGAI